MSTKLVKKLLRHTNAYDDPPAAADTDAAKAAGKRKKRPPAVAVAGGADQPPAGSKGNADPVQSRVQEMLRYDSAIARWSDSGGRALKRRLEEQRAEGRDRKRARREGGGGGAGTGHARGSAAPRLPTEPTFDKRKEKRRREMKSLQDLARMLQKSKKKKK